METKNNIKIKKELRSLSSSLRSIGLVREASIVSSLIKRASWRNATHESTSSTVLSAVLREFKSLITGTNLNFFEGDDESAVNAINDEIWKKWNEFEDKSEFLAQGDGGSQSYFGRSLIVAAMLKEREYGAQTSEMMPFLRLHTIQDRSTKVTFKSIFQGFLSGNAELEKKDWQQNVSSGDLPALWAELETRIKEQARADREAANAVEYVDWTVPNRLAKDPREDTPGVYKALDNEPPMKSWVALYALGNAGQENQELIPDLVVGQTVSLPIKPGRLDGEDGKARKTVLRMPGTAEAYDASREGVSLYQQALIQNVHGRADNFYLVPTRIENQYLLVDFKVTQPSGSAEGSVEAKSYKVNLDRQGNIQSPVQGTERISSTDSDMLILYRLVFKQPIPHTDMRSSDIEWVQLNEQDGVIAVAKR